ncbi:MAG: prenyltransferase [Lachnospiraceae bacterium]|nr:prenyltransferase [Lachnospiraceae bacterium]
MTEGGKGRLTPKMALGLAAPHTWAASVTPVLLTGAIVYREQGFLPVLLFLLLLCISILMQSAVNTFNDYYDMIRGNDSADDAVEASDAVLVYNDIPPRRALRLGFMFLLAAALLAVYPVWHGGIGVLLTGLAGAAIILLYSAGPVPLSHLPVGELVSGFVMGSLIPLGCYAAMTGRMRFSVMLDTLPVAFGIAMIMMTNNTCDIEKDIPSGRKTLPVLLGRSRALLLYRALLFVWISVTAVWIVRSLPYMGSLIPRRIPMPALALIIFCTGLALVAGQFRMIRDALRRPALMKRVSLITLLFGLSLTLASCAGRAAV